MINSLNNKKKEKNIKVNLLHNATFYRIECIMRYYFTKAARLLDIDLTL